MFVASALPNVVALFVFQSETQCLQNGIAFRGLFAL
jgi:hypothetical protein